MISTLRKIHYAYSVFIILFLGLLFYPLYYLFSRKPAGYIILNKLRKLNSLLCSWLTGMLFRFTFEQPLNPDQTYIYCANHTSNLDTMIFCILAKGPYHFMGKEELMDNLVLRVFFNTIDIPVNRESKMSAFRAFKRAGENLEKGMSLIIFPEGRIGEAYPPVLQPFKNGPFRLAIDKNIPIVPVSMIGVWKNMWDAGARYGSMAGISDIYIHQPVNTAGLMTTDADELKDRIFELINSKL